MRKWSPFALVTLIGALFPTAASAAAATPVASAGGDVLPAVVIAGAGAIVITLIMLLVPATRRGAGSPASPRVSAFRTHPIGTPAVISDPVTAPPASAAPDGSAGAGAVAGPSTDAPEPAEPPDTPAATTAPAAITTPAATRTATPTVTRMATGPEERGAVALADPPRPAAARPVPTPPPAAPFPSADPAPDLLAAFSPAAVLGDAFDPERMRRLAPDGPAVDLGPQTGARALLRDHSLVVPIAACVLIGVTVHVVRARRRR